MQTCTPTAMLGRVAGTANTAMFGPVALAIPLGSAAVGLGGRPPLVVAAAICLASALGVAHRPRSRRSADPDVVRVPTPSTPEQAGRRA
ncbi:hypothetical protein [Micromonospora echinospora]